MRVDLVDDGEGGRAAGPQLADDLEVAGHEALLAIEHEDQQIGVTDGLLALFRNQLMQRIFGRAEHAAGVEQREVTFCHCAICAITSRVVPGTGVTIARRVPVILLNSVDLPTLGRPTRTTRGNGAPLWGRL